jgi:hypothetical protein
MPALFKRLPLRRPDAYPANPTGDRAHYPTLAPDFAVLDEHLGDDFKRWDRIALRNQFSYRRQQVYFVLAGSALVSVLGTVQASSPGHRWPGIALAVVSVIVTGSTKITNERGTQSEWLKARVRAERLRAQYFRYLARVGPYAGPDRDDALQHAVVAVERGEEPA